ncbi:MAG: BlaI/MecI/CopY family transcriptional regulator [Verrucomicrobia bacterium]|nr:BlaI/MecI/CopY family transcriptional regulator [Verrucomicrobiota bacterium]
MPKPPVISESEWKIMKVLWAKSPLGAYDIIEALAKEEWHPNTVKTMLSRLTKKKALKISKYKNLYLYEPLVTEEQCLHAESESFLARFFGGSVKPLLVHFARKQKLTRADIDELKRILEKEDES